MSNALIFSRQLVSEKHQIFAAPFSRVTAPFGAPRFNARFVRRVFQKFKGKVNAGKVNCDQHKQLCRSAGVTGYPSLRFYIGSKDGNPQVSRDRHLVMEGGEYVSHMATLPSVARHVIHADNLRH